MRASGLFAAAMACASPPGGPRVRPGEAAGKETGDTALGTGNPDEHSLQLRWTPTPGGLSPAERDAGLAWSLSLLGARLPPEQRTWLHDEGDVLVIDFDAAGFPVPARDPVAQALDRIRESQGYQETGAADLARVLMRTLYEPWWYYAITGACPTLEDWAASRRRAPEATYGVTASLLVDDERLIAFNAPPYGAISEVAFQIQTFPSGLGTDAAEAETLDLMGSGQQRFGIYDSEGQLVVGADPSIVAAGQPGKCIWCHEGGLQQGSPENPHSPPHLDFEAWRSTLGEMNTLLAAHRAGLHGVDFDDPRVHTWSEWLVHELLRPTPARVAAEWGVPEADVLALVAEGVLTMGPHPEWPERGEVLDRTEVDALAQVRGAPPRLEILSDERDAAVALEERGARHPSTPAPGCW